MDQPCLVFFSCCRRFAFFLVCGENFMLSQWCAAGLQIYFCSLKNLRLWIPTRIGFAKLIANSRSNFTSVTLGLHR